MGDVEIVEKMMDFSKAVTLHGSSRVVKKWANYRSIIAKDTSINSIFILEEILFEIRRDLGQKRRGMKKGAILALFINDIDTILASSKPTQSK